MSATINQQVFVDYFGGAPVLEIAGFTHPVKDIYLEDAISHINYHPPTVRGGSKQKEEQQLSFRETYQSKGLNQTGIRAIENLTRSDRIDYQVCTPASVIKHGATHVIYVAGGGDCHPYNQDRYRSKRRYSNFSPWSTRDSTVYGRAQNVLN